MLKFLLIKTNYSIYESHIALSRKTLLFFRLERPQFDNFQMLIISFIDRKDLLKSLFRINTLNCLGLGPGHNIET